MSLTYAKVLLSTFVAVVYDKLQLDKRSKGHESNFTRTPIEQRLDLLKESWNSIEEDRQNAPICLYHIHILDKRLADLEHDKNFGAPAEAMLEEIQKRL